ncbi:Bcr/CflA family multidrug efflux MFS transporter [Kordiimonas lacus]|nr:Bcr/CflA family multidrug efflux MFS transporter [Kordiimonas lacus]
MKLSSKNTVGLALILGSVTALTPLAIDMYLPAFGLIAEHFGAGQSDAELSLTVFFIGLALGQLMYGPLADRFGRKPPLVIGLALASAATFTCALVPTISDFILLRFLQALGICAGAVISRAIVRDMFEPVEVARFFSLLMLVMGVAPILAPILGAQVALAFGWQAIFYFISGFGFLALLAITLLLEETHQPNPGVQLLRALSTYRDILRNRTFTGYALAGGAALAGMFGYITSAKFVLVDHFGVSPEHFGFFFGANAAGFIVMSQVNRWLVQRYSFHQILRVALPVVLLSALGLLTATLTEAPLPVFIIPLFTFIAVLGVVAPNTMAGALADEGHRAGAASALAGSLQFSLSFVSSGIIGITEATSPLLMCLVMTACAALSLLCFWSSARQTQQIQAQ